MGGLGIASIEEPPIRGLGAESLGVVREFFLLVVLRIHGNAGDVEIWMTAEFIINFPQLLTIADGTMRADGEKLGDDPDFSAEV